MPLVVACAVRITASAVALAFGLVAMPGCDADASRLRWSVRFADPDLASAAVAVEAFVVEDGCGSGPVVYSVRRAIAEGDGSASEAPALGAGTWGLAARAVNDGCAVIAEDCVERTLPLAESEELVLTLRAVAPPRPLCDAASCRLGACDPIPDGGVPPSCGAPPEPGVVHHRSVGTRTDVLYDVGHGTAAAGAREVAFGGGAALPADVGVGDRLTLDGEELFVAERLSDTQLLVEEPPAVAHSAASYTLSRAYPSLSAWEADRGGDLARERRREVAVVYADGPLVGDGAKVVEIDGSLTDAAHFMQIRAAPGLEHGGVAGRAPLLDGGGVTKIGIDAADDFTRLEGLELVRFASESGAVAVQVRASGVLVDRMIVHDFGSPSASTAGIRVNEGDAVVRNTFVYSGGTFGVRASTGARVVVESTTVHGMAMHGLYGGGGSVIATNTLVLASGGADLADVLEQSYNASSDATAVGTFAVTGLSPAAELVSVTPGEEDLHLRAGAEVIDRGADLGERFCVDIDGEGRPSEGWDIGADER